MNNSYAFRLNAVLAIATISLGLVVADAAIAQNYVPTQSYQTPIYNSVPQYNGVQQYNQVPQYNSVPQYPAQPGYNQIPQYNTVPQYNTIPQSALRNFQILPNTFQAGMQPAWSQNLTAKTKKEHDFGVVAMASKQVHIFEFANTTDGDLFLTSPRVSCGCTIPKILTQQVKPGEIAKVSAKFDTRKFYGKRTATVTVAVQKTGKTSEFGEVQFAVKGEIRRDVVFNPGEVDFASLKVAEASKRTVQVNYAGNSAWKILEVKSTNPNVTASAKETSRNLQTGRVSYDLIVDMNGEQAAGSINECLTIVTNDQKTSGMPIYVRAKVVPQIEVSPIQLGVINKGQSIKKKLILHSSNAFQVKEIKTVDPRIQFDQPSGEKTLHILTYTLDTSSTGQIDEDVTIVTSDPNQPEAKVPFSVQIVPTTLVAGESSN